MASYFVYKEELDGKDGQALVYWEKTYPFPVSPISVSHRGDS
jgi:hypothetical protein